VLMRSFSRISRGFLLLCILALAAFIVGLVLLGTVWKAPKGCEECDPYFGRMIGVYLMFVVSLLCAIIGIAFHTAAAKLGNGTAGRRPRADGRH
jgi:hypothetical protein